MKRFLLLFLAFTLLNSCSLPQRSDSQREAMPPPVSSDELLKDLQKATSLYDKNPQVALSILENLAKKHSNSSAGLEAHKILGDMNFRSKKYPQAYAHYSVILQNNYFEPFESSVCLNTVVILRESNQPQKALETLNRTLSFSALTPEERIALLNARLDIQKSYQDVYGQLETLGIMYNISTRLNEKESIRARASSLANTVTRPQDIQNILSNSRLTLVHPALHFRLGRVAFEKSDFSEARSHFNKVISLDSESEYAESAREYLQQLDARLSVNSKTVGVILPLSGKYADIGRSVLSSLQLGLGIYDNNSNIRLAVIDSEGKYLDARRAVEKLVVEDRVIAIIGSLQSKSAAAVSSKAQSLGVPTIVLSQKSGLTDIGPFVFRNALTSEMQVEHLVRVAREQMNISKFGILYPEDAYGIEYANLFWTEVEKMGGKVRAAQSYDPKETDFRAPIQRLVGTYYTDDRAIEYKQKLTEWENKKKRTSARHEPPQDLLPPLVDFEALFIPDSAKVLGQVSAMLAVSDVKGITLLGTNLWNTSGLAERAGPFNIIFVDSFYRNDPNFLQSPIVKEFQEKTGKIPTLFDIQAYDTAVVIKNALSSASSRTGLKEELSRLTSVRGALTNLQMLPSRDLSRPIVTLTVKDGQIVLMK